MEVQGDLKKALQRWDYAWRSLMAMLADLPEGLVSKQPAQGGWSVQQVLQHLCLAESQTLAYLQRKAADPAGLPDADIGSRLRVWALEAALASPLRFKAPAVAAEEHFPKDESWTETKQRIEANHAAILVFLDQLDPAIARKQLFRHPVAGRMPVVGVFRFFRWHVRHHQRQVWRILNGL